MPISFKNMNTKISTTYIVVSGIASFVLTDIFFSQSIQATLIIGGFIVLFLSQIFKATTEQTMEFIIGFIVGLLMTSLSKPKIEDYVYLLAGILALFIFINVIPHVIKHKSTPTVLGVFLAFVIQYVLVFYYCNISSSDLMENLSSIYSCLDRYILLAFTDWSFWGITNLLAISVFKLAGTVYLPITISIFWGVFKGHYNIGEYIIKSSMLAFFVSTVGFWILALVFTFLGAFLGETIISLTGYNFFQQPTSGSVMNYYSGYAILLAYVVTAVFTSELCVNAQA